MSSDYLEVMRKETDSIDMVSSGLVRLSDSFYATGNIILGDKLSNMAIALKESAEVIDQAVRDEVRSNCSAAQQASVNVISACLAGIESQQDSTDSIHQGDQK